MVVRSAAAWCLAQSERTLGPGRPVADHWWEGRPWDLLFMVTPTFMLFLVCSCRHSGGRTGPLLQTSPCGQPRAGSRVPHMAGRSWREEQAVGGGAETGEPRRRDGHARRQDEVPGASRVPGSWHRAHAVPRTLGLPSRQDAPTAQPADVTDRFGSVQPRLPAAGLFPVCCPGTWTRAAQPLRWREHSSPAPWPSGVGRRAGTRTLVLQSAWPLAACPGGGWEAGPAGQSRTSACSRHTGAVLRALRPWPLCVPSPLGLAVTPSPSPWLPGCLAPVLWCYPALWGQGHLHCGR